MVRSWQRANVICLGHAPFTCDSARGSDDTQSCTQPFKNNNVTRLPSTPPHPLPTTPHACSRADGAQWRLPAGLPAVCPRQARRERRAGRRPVGQERRACGGGAAEGSPFALSKRQQSYSFRTVALKSLGSRDGPVAPLPQRRQPFKPASCQGLWPAAATLAPTLCACLEEACPT